MCLSALHTLRRSFILMRRRGDMDMKAPHVPGKAAETKDSNAGDVGQIGRAHV